jgi:hypothetical protein
VQIVLYEHCQKHASIQSKIGFFGTKSSKIPHKKKQFWQPFLNFFVWLKDHIKMSKITI